MSCCENISCKVNDLATRWNFGDEKEPKIHRIHAYPAKFPAFITQKAVAVAKEGGVDVRCVADVFCGCGTTAFEARRLNLDFWGCDINPVATLIARVKSAHHDVDALRTKYGAIQRRYSRTYRSVSVKGLPARLNHWYSPVRKRQLKALLDAIRDETDGDNTQDFFLVAFSNILKPVSKWLTKSIKPQVDPNKKPETALCAFAKQFSFMIKAVEESPVEENTNSNIENVNLLEREVATPLADVIVTSPPYVTSYEYADLHQLSSLWLGWATDYRDLRKGTIGSMYSAPDIDREKVSLNDEGMKMVSALKSVDSSKAAASARYFSDMKRTVEKCRQMLRPGGMVFFVIGDTEYKGVKVRNSIYLAKCLEDAGFTNVEMDKRQITGKILTPYRNSIGRFSRSSNAEKKIYAEEYVLMGRKPDGNA